ncbi:hypothetical protein, partial [Klebsiella variicola]|uniref:hypothetical protein n=1 Tax=Klebsiella variicola TaxID=244366 RepID=UPI0027305C26
RLDLGINVIGSRRNSDIQWEEILNDGIDILFDDIVQYKGGILGVDHEGRIFKIDPKSSKINVTAHVMHIAFKSIRRKRLVES